MSLRSLILSTLIAPPLLAAVVLMAPRGFWIDFASGFWCCCASMLPLGQRPACLPDMADLAGFNSGYIAATLSPFVAVAAIAAIALACFRHASRPPDDDRLSDRSASACSADDLLRRVDPRDRCG